MDQKRDNKEELLREADTLKKFAFVGILLRWVTHTYLLLLACWIVDIHICGPLSKSKTRYLLTRLTWHSIRKRSENQKRDCLLAWRISASGWSIDCNIDVGNSIKKNTGGIACACLWDPKSYLIFQYCRNNCCRCPHSHVVHLSSICPDAIGRWIEFLCVQDADASQRMVFACSFRWTAVCNFNIL